MESTIKSKSKSITDIIILFMCMFYPAVHNYAWRVVVAFTRIVGIDMNIEVFDAIVWGIVILLSLREIIKRLNIKSLLIYLLFAVAAMVSFIATSYDRFTVEALLRLVFQIIPFFLLGSILHTNDDIQKELYIMSIITLIISIMYSLYFISSRSVSLEDNMDFAYKTLPSILIIISKLFIKGKKKFAIFLMIIGVIFLILQGTRGPLLVLAIYVCLMLYKKHGMGRTVVLVSTVIIGMSILLSSQAFKVKMMNVSQNIDYTGYSSRFILMLISGDISDSNGREAIKRTLLDDIKDSPLAIRGLFADRHATRGLRDAKYSISYEGGTYAHSLWLELIYDYGILIGGALIVALFTLAMRFIKYCTWNNAYIMMVFICMGIVQLIFSGTFIENQSFFFLIGLIISHKHDMVSLRVNSCYSKNITIQGID